MTRTTRLRRTILQFRQIFFTDVSTFIFFTSQELLSLLQPTCYFARKTIRARLKSYGVSSTVTLSPGRMRM